jgi:hypothetical protein
MIRPTHSVPAMTYNHCQEMLCARRYARTAGPTIEHTSIMNTLEGFFSIHQAAPCKGKT